MTVHEATASEVAVTATLGALVARRPARAELFERLRFDYCCGGAKRLAAACQERGLDLDSICQLIATTDAAADLPAVVERRDWEQASLDELCDHIVEVHHDGLRQVLPQIQELLNSVMRVHGPVDLGLHDVLSTFAGLRGELEPHMELGEALTKLRELTGDYNTAWALCRTHHRLIEALRSLERDLHQHVHEENNLLLPRRRSHLRTHREATAVRAPHQQGGSANRPDRSREELPLCCRGWLGEQTHRAVSTRAH